MDSTLECATPGCHNPARDETCGECGAPHCEVHSAPCRLCRVVHCFRHVMPRHHRCHVRRLRDGSLAARAGEIAGEKLARAGEKRSLAAVLQAFPPPVFRRRWRRLTVVPAQHDSLQYLALFLAAALHAHPPPDPRRRWRTGTLTAAPAQPTASTILQEDEDQDEQAEAVDAATASASSAGSAAEGGPEGGASSGGSVTCPKPQKEEHEQAEAVDAATAAASSAGPAAKQGGSCSFLLMPEDCSLLTASKRAKRTIVGQAGELV